jgi:hypothetical protein
MGQNQYASGKGKNSPVYSIHLILLTNRQVKGKKFDLVERVKIGNGDVSTYKF